jgi:hypothetical protein
MRYMVAATATLLSLMALFACGFSVDVDGVPDQIELTGCPPLTGWPTQTQQPPLTDAGADTGCICQQGDPMCDCL